jgi:hypothetical protein
MIKITNEIDGKKYELVESDNGCDDCSLRKRCKHWTDAPQWGADTLCLKLDGAWREVRDETLQ